MFSSWRQLQSTYLAGLILIALPMTSCGRNVQDAAPSTNDAGAMPTQGSPTIAADPNPVPLGTSPGPGKTTVRWTTGDNSLGNVKLSIDGGEEKEFAMSRREGAQEAAWIHKGKTYEFRLYSKTTPSKLLASVKVTRATK